MQILRNFNVPHFVCYDMLRFIIEDYDNVGRGIRVLDDFDINCLDQEDQKYFLFQSLHPAR